MAKPIPIKIKKQIDEWTQKHIKDMSDVDKVKKVLTTRMFILRKVHNFSQDRVAEGTNISEGTYGRFERGETAPSIDFFIRLSIFYDIPLKTLFDSDENFNHMLVEKQLLA